MELLKPALFVIFMWHVSAESLWLEAVGSVDGNVTFWAGSSATIICKSSKRPLNLWLGINSTGAAECNPDCNPSVVISEKYRNITFDPENGRIIMFIKNLSIDDGATTFACDSVENDVPIRKKLVLVIREKGISGSGDKMATAHFFLGFLFSVLVYSLV